MQLLKVGIVAALVLSASGAYAQINQEASMQVQTKDTGSDSSLNLSLSTKVDNKVDNKVTGNVDATDASKDANNLKVSIQLRTGFYTDNSKHVGSSSTEPPVSIEEGGMFNKHTNAYQGAADVSGWIDNNRGLSAKLTATGLFDLNSNVAWAGVIKDGSNTDTIKGQQPGHYFYIAEGHARYNQNQLDIIVGRYYLDTPLIFSEQFSIVKNSFEGVGVRYKVTPELYLGAHYIMRANGLFDKSTAAVKSIAGVINDPSPNGESLLSLQDNRFKRVKITALNLGYTNNSLANGVLTVDAWGYNVKLDPSYVDNSNEIKHLLGWITGEYSQDVGVLLGGQYQYSQQQAADTKNKASHNFALMGGWDFGNYKVTLAGSKMSAVDEANININKLTRQSAFYTEMLSFANSGIITRPDALAGQLSITSDIGNYSLEASYTYVNLNRDDKYADGVHELGLLGIARDAAFDGLDIEAGYAYIKNNPNKGAVIKSLNSSIADQAGTITNPEHILQARLIYSWGTKNTYF